MDDRERIVKLETQFESLIEETRGNSQAIGGLTDAITELRIVLGRSGGMLQAAFMFASIGTVIIGAISTFFYWLFSVLHK